MHDFLIGYLLGQYTDRQKTGAALADVSFFDTHPSQLDIEEAFVMYQKYFLAGKKRGFLKRILNKKHHLYNIINNNDDPKDTPSP